MKHGQTGLCGDGNNKIVAESQLADRSELFAVKKEAGQAPKLGTVRRAAALQKRVATQCALPQIVWDRPAGDGAPFSPKLPALQ